MTRWRLKQGLVTKRKGSRWRQTVGTIQFKMAEKGEQVGERQLQLYSLFLLHIHVLILVFRVTLFTDFIVCLVEEKSKTCYERNQDVRETSRSRGMHEVRVCWGYEKLGK